MTETHTCNECFWPRFTLWPCRCNFSDWDFVSWAYAGQTHDYHGHYLTKYNFNEIWNNLFLRKKAAPSRQVTNVFFLTDHLNLIETTWFNPFNSKVHISHFFNKPQSLNSFILSLRFKYGHHAQGQIPESRPFYIALLWEHIWWRANKSSQCQRCTAKRNY